MASAGVFRHAATGAFHLRCESRATSIEELFYRAFSSIRGRRSGRTQTLVDRSLTGGP